MIVKTEATVLSIRAYSRTSHVVTWLTRDYGRVITAVKGACRVKSAFLGQYDLCYTCELLFYRRAHNGIHAIRECTPLQLREPLRSDWRAATAAGYIADLTARLTMTESAAAVFGELSHALDILCACTRGSVAPLIFWYEMRLLRHLGIAPDFTLCPECHPAAAEWLRFAIPAGRLVCPHRTAARDAEPSVTLHRDVVKLLRRFGKCDRFRVNQYAPLLRQENKNDKNSNLMLGLSRFLGIFIVFHLDLPVAVRQTAFETLNSQPTLQ